MRNVRSMVPFALVLAVGLAGGCLSGDAPVERGWGRALAVFPGEVDAVWGLHAPEGVTADETPVALVEWLGADPSGRVVQGAPDGQGGRIIQIDTPEGIWSAAVDAEGGLLWSDPIPDDPWAFAAVVADVGLTLEQTEQVCDTCTAGIAPWLIVVGVAVVVAGAAALYTALRDPPNNGMVRQDGTRIDARSSEELRSICGPRPEGDVTRDKVLRKRYFEWVQCMNRESRRAAP